MTIPPRNRATRFRRWLERLLLLTGLLGVSIWAGSYAAAYISQSWEDWGFDRRLHGEPVTARAYFEEHKSRIENQLRRWLGIPTPSFEPDAPPSDRRATNRPPVADGGVVGRLVIPRINIRRIVREGTREPTLTLALGHIEGTALPGERGNVGIAGHRDTMFRRLGDIAPKDVIVFETLRGNFHYRVEKTSVVHPRNIEVLRQAHNSELTLVTCYPFDYIGPAPERFIVKARLVSAAPPNPEKVQPSVTKPFVAPPRRKPSDRKIGFVLALNRSRPLAPGISVGITGVDERNQRVDGWMWLARERRTVWLRRQSLHKPVVIYSRGEGRRALVLTRITRHSISGYLLLPPESKVAASAFTSTAKT